MTFFEEYLQLLRTQHVNVRRALAGLPQEAIDWTSENIANPLGALAAHVAGSERYWMGDIVAGEPHERDRAGEFQTRGRGETQLLYELAQVEDATRAVLGRLPADSLAETRSVRSGESVRTVTVGWVLLHVLEHTAYHAGQMSYLRRTWLDRRKAERDAG